MNTIFPTVNVTRPSEILMFGSININYFENDKTQSPPIRHPFFSNKRDYLFNEPI